MLVTMVDSSHSEYNADCDYGIVEISRELQQSLADRAKRLRQLWKHDHEVWEIYYWGAPVDFVSYSDDLQAVTSDDGFNDTGWIMTQLQLSVPEDRSQRIECAQTILEVDPADGSIEVKFTAIPKHSDIYVTTRLVPLSSLLHPTAK